MLTLGGFKVFTNVFSVLLLLLLGVSSILAADFSTKGCVLLLLQSIWGKKLELNNYHFANEQLISIVCWLR